LRRLIVNADDLGLTLGVNRAIGEAHAQGIVTSATLMANSAAFDDAVAMAKSHAHLGVGCHVVLVDGRPILARQNIRSLVSSAGDRFSNSLRGFALRVVTGRIDPAHIEAEATAQIRKIQHAGIAISHFDTHKHTHVLPQMLRPLLRAARSCGIRAVRNPFEPLRRSLVRGYAELWKQYVTVKLLHQLAGSFREEVAKVGMATTDGSIGIVATGFLDDVLLRRMIDALPEGTWELVCHPGYNDAGLEDIKTRLRKSRAKELNLLTSPDTLELLKKNGIQLASYRDIG
jgi:hopanoid biosynthesis associated protein HpnK